MSFQPPKNPTLPGEVPMKLFRRSEADRLGLSEIAIHNRIYGGKHYPKIKLRRVNRRVVFVTVAE
jgi:hypothetical protein